MSLTFNPEIWESVFEINVTRLVYYRNGMESGNNIMQESPKAKEQQFSILELKRSDRSQR